VSQIHKDGILSGRLDDEKIDQNFQDLHPPYEAHEALVASDRCYFCHDAPCMTACPTSIDIPLFIRQIATGTPEVAAKTIFDQNILGGMCARVCPTETLCEQACVREAAEGKPVEIGRLQRYATDRVMEKKVHPYKRAPQTGKRVAVVGAGPAGLSCAHRLALLGHDVVLFDAKSKAGGLNEFGIAAYKSTNDFAQEELNWLLSIGGIEMRLASKLGDELSLGELQQDYDAVFLSIGLAGVNALSLKDEDKDNILDAVDFISEVRQSEDLSKLPIGRRVVVVGGGMTAIDAGVQAKLLGAEDVTIVYRRNRDGMGASQFEQDLATQKGVRIITNATPVGVEGSGKLSSVKFAYTNTKDGELTVTDEHFTLQADQLFKAIGQKLDTNPAGLEIKSGKIMVNESQQTSMSKIWAGGDCASGGDDLTVTAVAEGRDAAENIHITLMEAK